MKLLRKSISLFVAIASSAFVIAQSGHAATLIHNDGFTANNLALPNDPSYGSNVATSAENWGATVGAWGVTGTPDIALTWASSGGSGNSSGTGFDTYTNWNGRGNVIQLESASRNYYISFVPENGMTGIAINSFDLDAWNGWPTAGGPDMDVNWFIRDTSTDGSILASGNWTRSTGGRDTISTNFVGNPGQTLVLHFDHLAPDTNAWLALDNLSFDQIPEQSDSFIASFTSNTSTIDGSPITLSWEIRNPLSISTITLDDGDGPVDVINETNTVTGLGSFVVNPPPGKTYTYTLTVNGDTTRTLILNGSEVLEFTTSAVVAMLPDHQVTLSWQVDPPAATVMIADGTNKVDATADTDPVTGIGSKMVTVNSPSTFFELSANSSIVRRVRVLRETLNSAAFSLDQTSITTDGSLTVSWTGAVAGPTDWIGIYRIGDTPGGPPSSTQWNYLNGTRTSGPGPSSGSMTFTGLEAGDYFAAIFLNAADMVAEGPIVLSVTEPPPASSIASFTSNTSTIDGFPITLSWEIQNPLLISTITLDDGDGPVDVINETNTATGFGSFVVNPPPGKSYTYTLTVNGDRTRTLIVHGGEVLEFTTSAVVAMLPDHQVTLSWLVVPPDATVMIDDGTNKVDATADTDPVTGIGSKVVTVTSPSTFFELSANSSSIVGRVRVLRETLNSDALSLDQTSITADGSLTVSWTGAVAGPTDWIGIYRIGNTPGGSNPSTQWNYLNGTRTSGPAPSSGSMTFTGLEAGDYFAAIFLNNAHMVAEGPIVLSVTEPPPAAAESIRVVSTTRDGDKFTIKWESRIGFDYDIYASNTLEGDRFDDWEELEVAWPSEGDETTGFTEDLSLLPGGPPERRFYRIFEYEILP